MDDIDRKILTILQQDATVSVARISERVGLSQTPCWKRIQRLEATGVILQRVALLAPEKLGLGLTVFVLIESSDHSAAWLEQFARVVADMPEVMEVYRMAGDADYMLRVVVSDMQSYDRFYKRLIATASLKNVTSRFAMERIKQNTAFDIKPRPRPGAGQGRANAAPGDSPRRRGSSGAAAKSSTS
jgi:Lrp/AsnC family transcriptional regulator